MTDTYTPRAGSLPSRVIDVLRDLGPGAELPTADLAARVDHPASTFAAQLNHAQRVGAVITRNDPTDARKLLWSLPGAAPEEPEEPAAPAKVIRTAFDLAPALRTAPPPEANEPECRNLDAPATLRSPPPKVRVAPAKAILSELMAIATVPPRAPRFALWDDGTLEIRRDGYEPLLLPVDDTKRLLEYLDRLREAA